MAIHISTDYYWIRPPQELKDRAYNLAYIGALANKLKLNDIYNKAKDMCSIEECEQDLKQLLSNL